MRRILLLVLLVSLSVPVQVPAQTEDIGIDSAKVFFEKFIHMKQTYDTGIITLYSDDAVIRQRQYFTDGKTQTVTIASVKKYEAAILQQIPKDKASGIRVEYTDVTFSPEAEGYRINGLSSSSLNPYSRPFSMLIKQDEHGKWHIMEELMSYFIQ
jgi:hypothetical protein